MALLVRPAMVRSPSHSEICLPDIVSSFPSRLAIVSKLQSRCLYRPGWVDSFNIGVFLLCSPHHDYRCLADSSAFNLISYRVLPTEIRSLISLSAPDESVTFAPQFPSTAINLLSLSVTGRPSSSNLMNRALWLSNLR